ncbi:MAG: UDP-3-O-acyl-N-acetylglucosamine deacetylase [Zetaproteobacteria bacterium]|nr:MAG: UDP-3-O-acyl-N-acetylglucosamine deacetylase [Zetaproteobacteria bacterium]
MIAQRTLNRAIHCGGIGLHSGKRIELTLHPAPAGSGITFVRSDLGVEIPARSEFVADTRLCTTLGRDGATVSTVEHLLSALAGLGVDNARVEVNGGEVPIMDGSAAPFVFLIQCAGIRTQERPKRVMRILRRVAVEEGDKRCALYPAQGFRVSYLLDYDHPLLSNRRVTIDFSRQAYTREVSRARTFGFLHEVESLQKMGLALGGSLENAVCLDAYRVLNEGGLRYEDECVRHKILDTVGDLALAGMPIVGAFEGERTGHACNHRLVQKLLTEPESWRVETLAGGDAALGRDAPAAVPAGEPA